MPAGLRARQIARHRRGHPRPRRWTSIRSATTSAAPDDAPVTIVEYGDFECPYCGQAEQVIRELLAARRRRALRLAPPAAQRRAPNAQLAAEASEAAAAQGRFWEMYDAAARPPGRRSARATSRATPRSSDLDAERFAEELRRREYAGACQRGRRQRRRERRLGNADLLHQRPPPLRRLRHRRPEAGRAGRQEPGDAHRSHPEPGSLTAAIMLVGLARGVRCRDLGP